MSFNKRASICSKTSSFSSTNSKARLTKVVHPRKVLQSKALPPSREAKSCSTGVIGTCKKPETLKKVTKSEQSSSLKKPSKESIDYCKNCGDSVCNGDTLRDSSIYKERKAETIVSNNRKLNCRKTGKKQPKSVQQYYINENFKPSTESLGGTVNGFKKVTLDTIKEVSEIRSYESLFKIFESEDENEDLNFDYEDFDSKNNLDDIKEFRLQNYFECHSANSRIKNKASATSLQDHKCVYRFYLNDRLFPVPLCTDHTKEIRCIECLLPMDSQVDSNDKINGTIQAKVTLGKQNQNVMILLPVKEPMIINEKRKEIKKEKDEVFFGLINLDSMGHSAFKSTLPENSLALKYQKGFQELKNTENYSYNDIDKHDVIVI